MIKTPIYCFSGLGADHRVFQKLENEFNFVHIKWIEPLKKETLDDYATRITKNIIFPKEFHILGLSFGGVMAQILADKVGHKKLILLSTFTVENHVSWFNKLLVLLGLNHLFNPKLFSKMGFINNIIFGAKSSTDKALLKIIISDTSRNFFLWATNHIVRFKPTNLNKTAIYLHGSKDLIIPFKKINNVHEIKGAGHFLTLSHSEEIKNILHEHLT